MPEWISQTRPTRISSDKNVPDFNFTVRSRSGPPGVGAKLFISIVLVVFLIAGIAIFKSMLNDISPKLATRSWQPTPCSIISGYIPETPPYKAAIHYSYASCGQTHRSETISINYNGSDDFYDAQKILDAFPAGKPAVCRVNPADPSKSVLRIPTRWMFAILLSPMIFIAVGGGGLIALWRPRAAKSPAPPLTQSKLAKTIFGAGFLLSGLVLTGFLVRMITGYHSAQAWQPVPCTIVQSKIGTHVSHGKHGDSTTYSVDVLFRYTFNGQPHDSSRYKLLKSSDSNFRANADIVDYLNRNRHQTAYVNPSDPDDAVLDRSFDALMLIFGGVGLVMGAIGFFVLRSRFKNAGRAEDTKS